MGIQLYKCPQGAGPLLLQFNVDVLPLFKSSSMVLWPIVCYVKQSQLEPLVVGLYCGKRKPVDIFEYLDDFVKDLSKLLSDGITENEVHGDVAVDCFVCDAPARAYEKNVKTFSGYYRCDKCSQECEYVQGKVTFPVTTALLCTDADFNNKINEEHHNGPTPLSSLNFGLVTGLDDVVAYLMLCQTWTILTNQFVALLMLYQARMMGTSMMSVKRYNRRHNTRMGDKLAN